jgi:hypothetical protein
LDTTAARIAALSLVLVTGCAAAINNYPGWDAGRGMVSVRRAGAVDSAFARAIAAFSAEGLTIENADRAAGFIVSNPLPYSTMNPRLFTYRATVLRIPGADSAEILLSGTERYGVDRADPEHPLKPDSGAGFSRIDRIAARLR